MSDPTVYELTLSIGATATVFAPGHRIRLDISSSNFPRFDRNTNTGGLICDEGEAEMRTARNRIHHRAQFASRLILPVVAG